MNKPGYEPRWYREQMHVSELVPFCISHQETDLWIGVNKSAYSIELQETALRIVTELRAELDGYIKQNPAFLYSLSPYQPALPCPQIAREMAAAAAVANVGPMAAVAGAFSQTVALRLIQQFPITDLIIENGGDIYLLSSQRRRVAIFAGTSPLSNKIALEIEPSLSPLGICTSSGTVGHSLSFGKADAVTVLAKDTALADAYATAIGNMVKDQNSINAALAYSATQPEILGVVIVVGDQIGLRGNIKIVKI